MNHEISSQYLTKDKIIVTILEMIDPAHFVVKECPDLLNASSKAKNFLEAEAAMQIYYTSVEPCFFQLPLKDAIIVVLYKEKFYRAKVIRILTLSAGHLFKVYLVDYGIECSVPRDCIYEIAKDFLSHDFQAINIKLLGIEPISLIMDKIDLTISYGPVSDWDPSAVIHINDLQKSMCSAYIEVQGIDDSHVYGKLFICFESISTKCINDELVSKSFARFNEDCWKNIKKLESILEGFNTDADNDAIPSNILENANLKQVPTVNLSNTEFIDEDFKVMFINPADGKIVAESTLKKDDDEKLSLMDDASQLQDEAVAEKEIIPDLNRSENKFPAISKEKTSETEVHLLTQRHLQKLINKKKRLSLRQTIGDDSENNLEVASMNKTVKSPTMPCKSSYISISSSEVSSQNNIDSGRTVNQNELIKFCENNINSLSVCESNILEDTVSKTEEKSGAGNMTQDQLIAKKRLMKLQQVKRKSRSPIKASDIDHSLLKTSPTVSTSVLRQQDESVGVSKNLKQLQKLQKLKQLKQKKKSSEGLEKSPSDYNQFEELSVNTSFDSSLCDSDSGLNSFSSSPATSDKGFSCCLL